MMRVTEILFAYAAFTYCGGVRGSSESPELKPLPTLAQHTNSKSEENSYKTDSDSDAVLVEMIPQVNLPQNREEPPSTKSMNKESSEYTHINELQGDNGQTHYPSSVDKAKARFKNPPWSKYLTTVLDYLYFGETTHDVFVEGKEDTNSHSNEDVIRKNKNKKSHHSVQKVNCSVRLANINRTETAHNGVTLVNDSSLQLLLKHEKTLNQTSHRRSNDSSRSDNSSDSDVTVAECQTLLLFAPWCAFSAKIASHYNALSRLFPDLSVLAINAVTLNYWNARFGTVAVPNVLLFHNGKFVAKYNYTEKNIESLAWFIQNFTNLNTTEELKVIDEDFIGPVPTEKISQTDYYLVLAWSVIISALGYGCYEYSGPMVRLYRQVTNVFNYDHHHMD